MLFLDPCTLLFKSKSNVDEQEFRAGDDESHRRLLEEIRQFREVTWAKMGSIHAMERWRGETGENTRRGECDAMTGLLFRNLEKFVDALLTLYGTWYLVGGICSQHRWLIPSWLLISQR